MQYFTIQAKSHREAIERMKLQYGEHSKILTYRNIKIGGILGFFGKDGIEITGFISQEEKNKGVLEDQKIKVLETMKKEQTLHYILKELREIKQGAGTGTQAEASGLPETIKRIRELLVENDFSQEYAMEILERIRKTFSLHEIENFMNIQSSVVSWIGESIQISRYEEPAEKPKVMIVVGPTGVGKTTTIAKLAALYGIESNGKKTLKVRIITIDNYRIGAKKQIEIYGEIMRIPVSSAENDADIKKLLALYQDSDLILIDTIGKSQRDYKKLAEMREILDGAGTKAEVHLTVSATTKIRDLEEVFKQFEPFGYTRVIITKLDETSQIGNIVSVLSKKNKPVSYITDGQKVPQDIEEATVTRLLLQLEGFRIDREQIEQRYRDIQKVPV
ncbi:MAG: flagellar biosynthesis protein FlhF [Spirochaetaceae bacterium]|nr:MAG: flagellar biosynthesis protein FlhF [Spirochaetaceae bacterium]